MIEEQRADSKKGATTLNLQAVTVGAVAAFLFLSFIVTYKIIEVKRVKQIFRFAQRLCKKFHSFLLDFSNYRA